MTDPLPEAPAAPRGAEPATPAPVVEDADALLDRLEAAAASGRRGISRTDALALHAVALHAARGHGAFEVAIGEGLDLILRRGGLARLGCSGVGDLAREQLGLLEGPARRLRRNAEKLRARPLLRAAIVSGEVTSRKAEVVLERTEPADDAYWTARARVDTVRGLETALRREPSEREEDWHTIELALPPEEAVVVRTALDYAGILEGPTAPHLRKVEVVLMEFLGEFGLDPGERAFAPDTGLSPPADVEREPGAQELRRVSPPLSPPTTASTTTAAPAPVDGPFDPEGELRKLQALVRARAGLDERLRRACLLVRRTTAWRWTGHRTFTIWCAEGLGISPRTIRSLVALERRLQELPPLRDAVRAGALSTEQARQVSRHATPENVVARIAEAASRPVIETRRQADAEDERQMWDAAKLRVSLPDRVAVLLRDALRAGRHHFPGLDPGQIVVCIAAHCVLTWRPEVKRILGATDEVILRDRWRCQIPGCSRPAEHVHHIRFRSRGGPDARWNLLGLCVPHHLHGVHAGHVEIAGQAPDGLTFIVGEAAVRRARAGRRAPGPSPAAAMA